MTTTKHDVKHMSRIVTDGPHRAPARAMLRAVGMNDDDMDRAFIAVANLASDVTPCNVHLDRVAQACKEGVRRANGFPLPLRHHHRLRRHLHGHRGHEGLPRQPRGHRRLHRDRLLRREHGRPHRRCRLRQEHARLADGDGPPQHPLDLRLRRRHPARQLPRQGHQHPGHV